MTVKDLIANKDYDYISWRVTAPDNIEDKDIFFGACKSKDGKLIPLDGDSYFENEIVVRHEEWSTDEIKNGLTVVVEAEWS
jgi:hypothetical protein